MGRKLREDPPGAWHHLVNRGARRYSVFIDDDDRQRWVDLLVDACDRTGVEVGAFVLMGNHWHIVARCGDGSVSQAMHSLAARYTVGFNRAHGFDGPLCRGRFESKLIRSGAQLLATTRYVHRNPLEVGLDIRDYPWSSYPLYLSGQARPDWLARDLVTEVAGGPAGYQLMVEGDLSSDDEPLAAGVYRWQPQPRLRTESRSLQDLVEAVAEAASCPTSLIRQNIRGGRKNTARSVAVLLAHESGQFDMASIAAHFGFDQVNSARTASWRARYLVESDVVAEAILRRAECIFRSRR